MAGVTRPTLILALVISSACGAKSPSGPSETISERGATNPSGPRTADTIRAKWRAGQPLRILVLGNSVSNGWYADGWERIQIDGTGHLAAGSQADDGVTSVITQVRRLVRSKNPSSEVHNESGDGYLVSRMIAWFDQLPQPKYDLAFVALQINDANQGAQLPEFKVRTQQLVDRLKAAGIVPVLVKENDIYTLPESRFGTPFSDFQTAVEQVAAQSNVSIVDGYTPFHAAVVAGGGIESCGLFPVDDGVHPNQKGHDILFRAYEEWFKK